MKAAVIHEFGNYDVLKLEEVPTPKPKRGYVLIKILAAGVNRFEHYLREGSVAPELPFPHILGTDAAGEVFGIGQGVEGFEVGERVIPVPGYPQNEADYGIHPASLAPSFTLPGLGIPGTYAQYIEVPERFVVKDDTGLPADQVATLPVALATAVRSVKEIGGVRAGDRVLVHSGAGGAGGMQIQVAKALGAQVATTVRSAAKAAFAEQTGADRVIDATKEDFVEKVMEWTDGRGADVVIDNLGGDVLARSIDAARPKGVIVVFGFVAGTQTTFDLRSFFFAQKELRGSMASDISDLRWGLEQVEAGRIRPLLDRSLPLSRAAEAHRLVAESLVKGSIALLPWAA